MESFIILGILGEQELLLLFVVIILFLFFGNKFPRIIKTIGKDVHDINKKKKELEDDIFKFKNFLK